MATVEQVGIIPRGLAQSLGLLRHGFSAPKVGSLPDSIQQIEAALTFVDRPPAEEDPSRKQIIPYAVVCRGDQVFTVERLVGGGEARLHGKISIGIGGHINPIDQHGKAGLIGETLRRELDEELTISGINRMRSAGFINDDTNAVGQVHLGIVFRVDLGTGGQAQVREQESLRGDFRPWSEVAELADSSPDRVESWSSFVIEAQLAGKL